MAHIKKRTNTASWDDKTNRWKIHVQKDGTRKYFYNSTPGRAGQREALALATDQAFEQISG